MRVRGARSVPRLLAATVLVASTLAVAPGRADATHGVTIAGSGTPQSPYIYQGVPASISAGDTMTWLNPTTVNHTMTPTTSPDPQFRSHDLDGQGSYHEYRFTVPGSYAFQCRFHPATMHATFSVLAAPPPTPTPKPVAPTAAPAPRPAPTATPNQRPTTPAPRPSASPAATPGPTPSAALSPVATPAPTPTATASAVAGVETESATTSGDTLPTAPTPPLTSAPVDTGGPGLPVVLGLLAVVVALLGGALWLRRRA